MLNRVRGPRVIDQRTAGEDRQAEPDAGWPVGDGVGEQCASDAGAGDDEESGEIAEGSIDDAPARDHGAEPKDDSPSGCDDRRGEQVGRLPEHNSGT